MRDNDDSLPDSKNAPPANQPPTRRSFLKGVGLAAGAATLASAPLARAQKSGVAGEVAQRNGYRVHGRGARSVKLRLNGKEVALEVEPRTTLLAALREKAGLTGTKEVCDHGSCGACTVLINGRSVCSCMMLAVEATDAEIETIEGVAADPGSKALIDGLCEHDAAQCGFCIPGFVVRSKAMLGENAKPDAHAMREGLAGNICRCGTYSKIFDGLSAATGQPIPERPANAVTLQNELPRVDIREKMTGAAKYTADIYLPRMIYAKFVRCPYGTATFKGANTMAAQAVAGVLKVALTKQPGSELNWVGARVGYVVGESRDAVDDAIAALAPEYELTGSPRSNAQALYEGPPAPSDADAQKLAAMFGAADAVVEATYATEVQTHSALETHGSVVDYRGADAEVWSSTQSVGSVHGEIGGSMGLESSKVEVHAEYVGGGFGAKFGVHPEDALAAEISKEFGRPCKVMLDRREEHLEGGNRPGSIQYAKMASARGGEIKGGRLHLVSTVGHSPGAGGIQNPVNYQWGDIVRSDEEMLISAGMPTAFRAPRWPQGVFAAESMVDELAAAIGMDPLAFRQKVEPNARRQKQYKIGAELIGWERRQPDGSGTGRLKRGLGMASGEWPAWPTRCSASADIYPSGHVDVNSAVQDIGTGTRTVMLDVAAAQLGLERKWITSNLGNSKYPPGIGSGGSTTARSITPAVRMALDDALGQLKEVVAAAWGGGADAVDYGAGEFRAKIGDKTLAWDKACAMIGEPKLSGQGRVTPAYVGEGSSEAVQFVEVEVDTETGHVRVEKVVAIQACGQMVNRLMLENQVCGGVIQGISFALFEERVLDRNVGGMLNANLEAYKIAGPLEVPEIIPVLDATEADTGVRGVGEPATIPTAGAIANAVANAIGARVRSLPITPEKVLSALDEMKREKGGRA